LRGLQKSGEKEGERKLIRQERDKRRKEGGIHIMEEVCRRDEKDRAAVECRCPWFQGPGCQVGGGYRRRVTD